MTDSPVDCSPENSSSGAVAYGSWKKLEGFTQRVDKKLATAAVTMVTKSTKVRERRRRIGSARSTVADEEFEASAVKDSPVVTAGRMSGDESKDDGVYENILSPFLEREKSETPDSTKGLECRGHVEVCIL